MHKLLRYSILCILLLSCAKDDRDFTQDSLGNDFPGKLEGTVHDRHGKGLSSVFVTLSPGGQTTISDANGGFEFGNLPTGKYIARFMKNDYRDTTLVDSMFIGLADSVTVPTQPMTYRYASITGEVQDREGAKLAGAGVAVELQSASTMAVSNGVFFLNRVEPGNVRLFVVKENIGYGYEDVTVNPDDTLKNISIQINRSGGSVDGSVINQNGEMIPDATISAVGGALTKQTESDGSFTLTTVPSEGTVGISVSMNGSLVGRADVQVEEGGKLSLPPIVIGDSLGDDLLITLPGITVLGLNSDSLILTSQAVWDITDSSNAPYWYLWSLDDGTWDSTSVPQRIVSAAQLDELKSKADCDGSGLCSFSIQVASATLSGLRSNTANITVLFHEVTQSPGSSQNLSGGTNLSSSSICSSPLGANSTFTDCRDGRVYRYVRIGQEIWMAENLAYLPSINLQGDTSSLVPKYYMYGYPTEQDSVGDNPNYKTYGTLYNWPAAMAGFSSSIKYPSGVQGVCPPDWHLPSGAEWDTLTAFVGSFSVAGQKLKSTTLWNSYALTTNEDAYGFRALPGGSLYRAKYDGLAGIGYWWTTEDLPGGRFAVDRMMVYDSENLGSGPNSGSEGFSVRCVYDTIITVPKSSTSGILSSSSTIPLSSSEISSSSTIAWCNTAGNCGSITDSRDGHQYRTVTIGKQTWLAENLAYLPSVNAPADQSNQIARYYVQGYDGTILADAKATNNYKIYGALYNWPAAMNGGTSSIKVPSGVQGICLTGWHLPSMGEWDTLMVTVGADLAGQKLKSSSYWTAYSGITNEDFYGFGGLPGGCQSGGDFINLLSNGFWWTTSEFLSNSVAKQRYLIYSDNTIGMINSSESDGYSVRCVKD